jgi:hypothetical protein
MASIIASVDINPLGADGGTSDPVDTTGADLIVIGACQGFAAPFNVTDSEGNTYTDTGHGTSTGDVTAKVGTLTCFNPITSANHTFTITATGQGPAAAVIAIRGGLSMDSVHASHGNTASTTIQAGSVTASNSPAMVISIVGASGAPGGSFSIDNGFTITDQVGGAAHYFVSLAYKFQTVATAIDPTWTASGPCSMAAANNTLVVSNTDETLTAGPGSYALTGEAALFGRSFGAARGLYTLTGEDAGFGNHPGAITADTGYYTVTGQAANFHLNDDYALVADPGFYNLTGFDATLCKRRSWEAQDCTDSPWTAVRKSNPN